MAKNRGFNGTIFSWGGVAVARITGVSVRIGGDEADVSSADDLVKYIEAGQDDFEISFNLVGGTTLTRRSKAAVAITWKDGTVLVLPALFQITSVEVTGRKNGEITAAVSVKPTLADEA